MSKTKVFIDRELLIKLIEAHVRKNSAAFFLPENSDLSVIYWIGRADVGCDVNLTFTSKEDSV